MSDIDLQLLTFAATALLVLSLGLVACDWLLSYRRTMQARLDELAGTADGDTTVSLFKDMKRRQAQGMFDAQGWHDWAQQHIEQAGMAWTPRAFAGWCALGGAGAAAAAACVAWWLAPVVAPLGFAAPLALVYYRRQMRKRKLSQQLPEVFQMISRAVRSGQTVPAALKIIAEDFEAPVSQEFALCYEQQNLGVSRESALRQLAGRTGIMELQIFVVALLVQAKSGGDLVELLDNLASMIRKRLKLKDRVRALTGEGRMQALVLLILPVAALLGMLLLSPDYIKTLLERPSVLVGTAVAQGVGAMWVRRIVNFEY